MKRLARLSLRLRLTLLFAVLTTAAWGMASVIAWQQTSKKLDKLFDTQQLLFARRLLRESRPAAIAAAFSEPELPF